MDRQDVEYIQREDTDEFDEFGRKKKKKKMDSNDEKKKEVTNKQIDYKLKFHVLSMRRDVGFGPSQDHKLKYV